MGKYKVNDVDYIFIPDVTGLGNYAPLAPVEVQTTDATPQLALTFEFPTDGIYRFVGCTQAASEDGSDWATFASDLLPRVVVVRSLGVLSIVPALGSQSPVLNAGPTSATWLNTFAIVGDTMTVTVQGANGVTVNWSVTLAFYTNTVA